MTELTLTLPADVMERLHHEAQRRNLPLATIVSTALERFFAEDDEPTKEEVLAELRQAMQDALAGRTRPIREVLAELDDDADDS